MSLERELTRDFPGKSRGRVGGDCFLWQASAAGTLPCVDADLEAMDDSSEQLLRRVLARGPGWMEAFGELVRRNEGWVRGFLRARIRDWAAADDLAQDVFVTAFRQLKGFRGDSGFEGWLRGIAVNHLRNFARKRRELCIGGHEELQVLIDREADLFLGAGDESGALDALRRCLGRIDGPARELLNERYVEGRSVRELAERRGRGYSALTMQLHRLRELLADCVQRKLEVNES